MSRETFKTYDMSSRENPGTSFLYNTLPGRILLSLLIQDAPSKLMGYFMDSALSTFLIPGFIRKNGIRMNEFKKVKYKSFNDFFTRELREGARPISADPQDLVSPCDGKLTAYPISADSVFKIKRSVYDVRTLLKDKKLADDFVGGTCLIFRLSPDDYHRYCYTDDGEVVSSKNIKGVLHTVRPIAMRHYRVFTQNTREYTVLQTKNFGKVVQMEVGALFVGRIVNKVTKGTFKRGEEKGMFEFGGSTIVMLFQKDKIDLNETIFENTRQNKETIVKMGCKLGQQGHGQ